MRRVGRLRWMQATRHVVNSPATIANSATAEPDSRPLVTVEGAWESKADRVMTDRGPGYGAVGVSGAVVNELTVHLDR